MGQMKTGGYLYIITNEWFEGWVKVGTTDNLTERLHVYQTGDPHRKYTVVYSLHHPKYREAAKEIKELMKPFAKRILNEWYEIDLQMAIPRLEESLEKYGNSHQKEDIKSP